MSDCWSCPHPAADHVVETQGDPMSFAPCSAPVGPPSVRSIRLHCDCRDYDGMEHPDRPSLASTMIFRTEDGGIGWVADPEATP